MGLFEIVIIMLVILGLIGVIIYFVYTYLQDKDSIELQISKAISTSTTKINNEQADRLANIKYVVDQVNNVNSDIATKFTSSNVEFRKSINSEQVAITSNLALQNANYNTLLSDFNSVDSNVNINTNNINHMNAGFGNYITFGNPAGTNSYNLLNLPSSPPANMNLMKQVNLVMGLTAQNLNSGIGSNISLCYGPGATNCTSFPDSDGNTVIAAPLPNSSKAPGFSGIIKLNASTTINGPLKICNKENNSVCASLTVDGSGNVLISDNSTSFNNKVLNFNDKSKVNWDSNLPTTNPNNIY
jgi:hypothetical protein